jgi:hypothetical protein
VEWGIIGVEEKLKLPIGEEFFKNIRTKGFYYVDKTGFIADLIKTRGSVNLFTRPRRFGKSLNLDMLQSFFEIGADPAVFEGLEISKEEKLCAEHMGRYPVISISLKDVEGLDFQTAYGSLGLLLSEEAERFDFLLESGRLNQSEKTKLQRMMDCDFEKKEFLQGSLRFLTKILCKHYGRPVIVLIDEYDVPLDKAYQNDYYLPMVQLIRSLFSPVLKTNKNLEFAVITGCLRIARESIFTGLNNFKVRTISDVECARYFGFTDAEVRAMLEYYGVGERFEDIKEWYDGYHFGFVDVYCPWDVINQCDKLRVWADAPMEPHWENSSSNSIVQDIIAKATETTKSQIEALISGEAVEKALISELTYTDLENEDEDMCQTYLWSVLFATGYLTDADRPVNQVHKLVIPNREVLGIYEKRILSWFKKKSVSNIDDWRKFCEAVMDGDAETVQTIFNEFMSASISIRDTYARKEMKENFYHGMLLGLLKAEGSWIVKSNAESGAGYTDIKLLIPSKAAGCIIEVKYAEGGAFDTACLTAMRQIEETGYVDTLIQEGARTIHKYGIACYKKRSRILHSKQELRLN